MRRRHNPAGRVLRRQRGAALVEAVVAIPFFLLVFACLLYIVRLFLVKEYTVADSRSKVWEYALNSCEGGGATKKNDPPSGAPKVNSKYKGATGGGKLDTNWGSAVYTSHGNVTTGAYLGFSDKLSTSTRMQCDEKPEEGNLINALMTAWHDKTKW